MLFIKQLIIATGYSENPLSELSMACISTSRPIYLVFNDKHDHPTFVIRELSSHREFQAHQVHCYLYHLVGSLVPRPLGLCNYAGHTYDIQQGVKGSPWFQIKSKFCTEDSRARLERRLWQTLSDFQSAITADSANETSLRPHEELRQVFEQHKETEQQSDTELDTLVEFAINQLSTMPNCRPSSQHGDFCLNNVIIDKSHVTVIDFEDFAITKMPLYDHFTLALSLPSCSPEAHKAVEVISTVQIIDAAKKLGIPLGAIKWHFLHHILLRLGPWSTGEKRSRYRAWLKQLLRHFIENQIRCIKLPHDNQKGGTT